MTDSENLKNRADIYRLLSACFYEPDRDLFIEERLCDNLENLLSSSCPGGADAANKMGKALLNTSQNDLAVDHTALFIGPFELPAPPYGSVYLEKGQRLMGDTTIDVQEMYRECGLALDIQEPADHIAFELEFMGYLCNQHDKDADEKRARFLRIYLSPWVSRFTADIREHAGNDFYRYLADCLEHFITIENANTIPVIQKMETDHAERAAV